MAMYTFYPCQWDGSSATLRARELRGDREAMTHARDLLHEFRNCAYVAVWHGDRPVAACPREGSPQAPAWASVAEAREENPSRAPAGA